MTMFTNMQNFSPRASLSLIYKIEKLCFILLYFEGEGDPKKFSFILIGPGRKRTQAL